MRSQSPTWDRGFPPGRRGRAWLGWQPPRRSRQGPQRTKFQSWPSLRLCIRSFPSRALNGIRTRVYRFVAWGNDALENGKRSRCLRPDAKPQRTGSGHALPRSRPLNPCCFFQHLPRGQKMLEVCSAYLSSRRAKLRRVLTFGHTKRAISSLARPAFTPARTRGPRQMASCSSSSSMAAETAPAWACARITRQSRRRGQVTTTRAP